MLIRPAELQAIRAGEVDLAFRRWDRPRLRVGTRMRTSVGLVEVTSLDVVAASAITAAEAAARRSRSSVADPPSGHLTSQPSWVETVVFKRNVRKLKERGLTEPLDVGYRLAPRGAAFLAG